MHPSAHAHMALCVRKYLSTDRSYRVLDFGSRCSPRQTATHRDLFVGLDCAIVGVDVQPGRNVDLVMPRPYRIPLRARSVDVVISGQVLEHVPFLWASVFEIARVLRPGGYFFLTVPSRGHVHTDTDCWRFYPDAMRALAAHAGLRLREAHTDFPPRDGVHHDHAGIDPRYYWGDTVGVFRKPNTPPSPLLWAARQAAVRWANHLGGIESVPTSRARPRRRGILGSQPRARGS